MKVAVLMGGWSNEREVSLTSGKGIADALKRLGHDVYAVDMGRDGAAKLSEIKPDVVFNALHGTPGEDGTVQGMLDVLGVKYTHSGLATSVIAIDKELTKQRLVPAGIPMPKGIIVESERLYAADPLPRPYVLKPVNEGSSVGVAIVKADGNYGNPIARDAVGPWQEFDTLLAEPFIKGRELTVAVLDGLTEHVCPAEIPKDIEDYMMELAQRAHELLGCKGASRTDFRWDDELGRDGVFVLETNTQPGMTPLSLVPEQAKQMGISYEQLVDILVKEALA